MAAPEFGCVTMPEATMAFDRGGHAEMRETVVTQDQSNAKDEIMRIPSELVRMASSGHQGSIEHIKTGNPLLVLDHFITNYVSNSATFFRCSAQDS